MEPQIWVLVILGVTILLLVTEWVPMALVGILIPVALVALGILEAKSAFAILGDPLMLLVACAFVYGAVFFKVGVADIIGGFMRRMSEKYAGGSEAFIIGLGMTVTVLLSSVLPNLGVVAVLMPVFLAIAKTTGIAAGRLLMPVAYASSMGGMITLIGSPTNLIGRGALEAAGAGTFGFFEFAWMGIPLSALGIAYMVTVGRRWLPAAAEPATVGAAAIREVSRVPALAGAGGGADGNDGFIGSTRSSGGDAGTDQAVPLVPRWHVFLALSMFALFVLGIILEDVTGIAAYLVGFAGLSVLVASRVLPEKDAFESISWSTLLFVGGILVLAGAIVSTGASTLMANSMVRLLGGEPNPYVLVTGLFLISLLMTQLMSNTATVGILAPIAISLATGIGGDPRALVMTVVLGSGCAFLTVIATPPNIMVAGPGKIGFLDWLRCGWPLAAIAFVLAVGIIPLVWPFYP